MGGGLMTPPDSENFSISGPSHLTSIDWTNTYHRTSVTSSLVQGVYTLERDRQNERVGPASLAKPWWDFFHFTLLETLIDDKDMSIYGAVFEYERYNLHQDTPHLKAPPRYVIAFRGTILESETILSDMKLNFRIFFNILPGGRRFVHAIQTIHTMVVRHSEPVIWLAGHSLGAALALLAGETMIRDFGFFLEAHIFNPPVVSFPLEQLPGSKMLKGVFQITRSVIKTTVATVLKDVKIHEDDPSWIPCLYVNPADPICSEYIGYFKHKIFMSKIGASQIEKTGARTSVRSLLVGRKGTSDSSTEPLHLLPSADMTINKNKPTESKTAHGLHQWWEQDSVLRANWESCCIRPYSEGKSGKLLN